VKTNHCFLGDNRDSMRKMLADGYAGKIQTIITSPPYWGLRDYGVDGQLGQEPTLREFLANMVEVFDLCRELLAEDGTLWLNMGDSYASKGGQGPMTGKQFEGRARANDNICLSNRSAGTDGLKSKDLCGQPWRLAFAMQDAGWYLRQDIIWHKPNPMPESIKDRCTKSHEYLFLLAKSERYYYDFEAMQEPVNGGAHARRTTKMPDGWDTGPGGHGSIHRNGRQKGERKLAEAGSGTKNNDSFDAAMAVMPETRNRRSVWTIPTESFSEAHFATFPQALVEPCILAGSRPGDIVFDPFLGSGTVAQVAQNLGRKWLGCELNPEYIKLQGSRTRQQGLILEVA
jgi:DNA modification methylase